MLETLGRAMYRLRWAIIAAWVVVAAIAAAIAPNVNAILHGGGYTIGNSQSVQAYDALHRAFAYRALTFTAVFTCTESPCPGLIGEAQRFRRDAQAATRPTLSIAAPVRSPDGKIVLERVYSQPQEDFGAKYATRLRALMPHGAIRGYLTGPAAIFHDMEVVSNQDLQRVEIVTLPIAAAVLILIFGSLVASATPVLMAPVSIVLSLAAISVLGRRIDMSIFVLNTASMLGLGVAIDYSLFMVNRFREELSLGRDRETAVGTTVATSGRAIMVSAVVVSIGFLGLSLTGVTMLRSIGVGGSIVTAFSLLVALTLVPAILGVLGPSIDRYPIVPRRLSSRRMWRRLSMAVMRHPWPVIGVVAFIIAALATPALHLRVGIPGADILPPYIDSRAGNDLLDRHLGDANRSPVLVVVQRQHGTPVGTFQSTAFVLLDRICRSSEVMGLSANPIPNAPSEIRSCQSALDSLQSASSTTISRIRRVAGRQSVALIAIFLRSDPSSAAAERYVSALRTAPPIPGYRVMVGGQTAGQMDFNNFLYARFPLVVLFVIVTIYLVLLFAFRSVLLPLKAVLMNVFSVLAAYGVVVFAFQDAHLKDLLGFTPVGNIDSIVPVFLFCVLFGISTDYEVFLLSRVQEEYLATGNNEESVARGLEVTGRIITSAAAVMLVVFGAFAFAQLVVIKELGLGLAVAVLVDATLIRVLLVPATMRLLGRWNWWLPFRGFPRVGATQPPAGKSAAAR